MSLNQVESPFEYDITPEKLREAAQQMELREKSPSYLRGQIITFRLNHQFRLVWRPEVRGRGFIECSRESEPPKDTPKELDLLQKESLEAAGKGEGYLKTFARSLVSP